MTFLNPQQWSRNLSMVHSPGCRARPGTHSLFRQVESRHAHLCKRNIVIVPENRVSTTLTKTLSRDHTRASAATATSTNPVRACPPTFCTGRQYIPHMQRNLSCQRYFSSTLPFCQRSSGNIVEPYAIQFSDQTQGLDFDECKNPTQLEKSISSYLKSHPEVSDQALEAMLLACVHLSRTAMVAQERQSSSGGNTGRHGAKVQSQNNPKSRGTRDSPGLRPNLLDTILQSSVFTSDLVFDIACSIHDDVARGLPFTVDAKHKAQSEAPPKGTRTPSLQVTNAFLNVCAMTGQFEKARTLFLEMRQRPQGDVKPDLTTYRLVLRAAAVHGRDLGSSAEQEEHVRRVDEILDQATNTLSRQAQVAFWMKMGLGGLVGATVGKFTMMGVMALPTSGLFESSVQNSTEGHVHASVAMDPSIPGEGMLHILATQEVALGIGLAVGMMTAGYVILGSTRQQGGAAARRHGHPQRGLPKLPRAQLFGLYFPDLATTRKNEIRTYLQQSMDI